MFVNIAARGSDPLNTIFQAQGSEDRILMPLWGAVWIFIFVVFQTVVLHRITRFLRAEGIRALFAALATPGEAVKLALALLFGFGYLRLLFGHYPFPSQPISISVAVAFGVFSWGVSALIVWPRKNAKPMMMTPRQRPVGTAATIFGAVFGFFVGGIFLVAAHFFPGLFYFHGMLGLFCITMFACQLLFLSSGKKATSDGPLEATAAGADTMG